MMERLREGASSLAVKIILGLIIFSFVFAGVGSYLGSGSQPIAATVGDREISRNEFEQAYQNERSRMQSQLGEYFSTLLGDPQYVQQFRKTILDRMINDILLNQRAQELGLRVSDAQVRTELMKMPAFQNAGQFDKEVYASALRRAGYTPEGFAETMRQDMTRNQLLVALQSSDFTLEHEIDYLSELEVQQREIRTITFDIAQLAEQTEITEEAIKAFYDNNQSQFMRPDQVKVSYIELSGDALKSSVSVSDEDIEKYFTENQDKYSTLEKRRVSHILIQGDDKEKAQAILDRVNNGDDFAIVAAEVSDDTFSAEKGGALDWFERGVMDPAFEKAAFELTNVNDRTELVKSAFGYHIIQLDGIEASVTKPLAEVKAGIVTALQENKAEEAFYELESTLTEVAFEMPDSLVDAAEAVNGQIKVSEFFSRSSIPQELSAPAVSQAIFSPEVREDGLNSAVIEIAPEHVIVVRVDDSRPAAVLPLVDVSDAVKAQLARNLAEQQAQTLATDTITALQSESGDKFLADNNLSFTDTRTIARDDVLAQEVFKIAKPSESKSVYVQARDESSNIIIIALDGVLSVSNESMKPQVSARLARSQTQQELSAVLDVLRSEQSISYPILETSTN
ncbi:MAG: peptidylprolyl isomerase [Aliivibrio sp.]|uniref:peptidylprolyl isomerase n=1 Tax=Aliivibrio sp. TaxID=1872443 RepID=UPI001A372374|nr:peptidylprolyl isomerase [Aliivibrio sp.]